METRVILCDICKKRIAKDKCAVCGNDLCGERECSDTIFIRLYKNSSDSYLGSIDSFEICQRCRLNDSFNKIMSKMEIYKEDKLEFANKVVNSVKKRMIVEKLEK